MSLCNILNYDCLVVIFSFLSAGDLVCCSATCKTLSLVAKDCFATRQIKLEGKVTAKVVADMANGYGPSVRHVIFDSCRFMSCSYISTLANACHNLKEINMVRCVVPPNYIDILASGCPNLRSISFDTCDRVADNILMDIARKYPLIQSVVFYVTSEYITDVGVSALASGCPDLRSIVLTNAGITDKSLAVLSDKCRKLEHANLTRSTIPVISSRL